MQDGGDHSIFVSHVHEDAAVAAWLQRQLRRDFDGKIDVYVSSERTEHAGEDWLKSIAEELRRCQVLIALCSPLSIHRPWVNFELGGAWMLDTLIIPACHGGLTPSDLKVPLTTLGAVELGEQRGMQSLYETLVRRLDVGAVAGKDFAALADAVPRAAVESRQGGDASIEQQMLDRDRAIRRRVRRALEAREPWRTIARVAVEAGISEDTALDVVRADDEVRLTRRLDGAELAGLISRVGP